MKRIMNARTACMAALLALLLAVANKNMWAQPLVQVPATCNVVVPAGGSAGLGGTVGDGGIVVMPDDGTGGGNFTVIPSTGTTILAWSLWGDLSINGSPLVPGVNPAIQTVASGTLVADIITYNKSVRQSEGTSPSNIYLARSKGRVRIGYNDSTTTCGGSIQFDIFKKYPTPTYLPPIIGPNCWEADSTYTYSVDQIASDNLGDGIGIDEYYWTVSNGSTSISNFYTSADKSSITLDAPNPVNGPWTITCCFGRANPWDANVSTPTSCVSRTIGVQPSLPVVSIPTCVDIGDPSFVASVPLTLGYSYTWSSSNPSWLLSPNFDGNILTVTALGDGPGIITLTVENGSCSSASSSDTVNRRFVSPIFIDGITCISDNSTQTYSILPSGIQGNPTCWTLPSGWTFTPLNGTQSVVDVHVPSGTPAGPYTITAFSCSCPSGTIDLTVNVRPVNPVIAAGDTCISFGSVTPLTYSVTPAGSYTWTIPSGWSGTSTTESITVTPNGTGVGTITAQGISPSGCNSLGTVSWDVNFSAITPSSATVGCLNFGFNSTTTATIANAPSPFYGTYLVTSTPTGLLGSPAATVDPVTGQITLNVLGTAPVGSYFLEFVHATPCDTSAVLSVPITMSALPITLDTNYTIAYDLYQVNPPIGSAYVWFFDGVPITPANNSPVLFLNNASGYIPTTVCVNVLNGATGCFTRVCRPGRNFGRSLGVEDDIRLSANAVKVYPNPNDGRFTMEVPDFEVSAGVRVVDASGKEVGSHQLQKGQNTLNEMNLAAGTYYLIFSIDKITSVDKIQIMQRQ